MDPIERGLWLGGRPRACDIQKLKNAGIRAIITVDMSPLDDFTFMTFKRLYIKAADAPDQHLIDSFEEAINFIEQYIDEGVLVHW